MTWCLLKKLWTSPQNRYRLGNHFGIAIARETAKKIRPCAKYVAVRRELWKNE